MFNKQEYMKDYYQINKTDRNNKQKQRIRLNKIKAIFILGGQCNNCGVKYNNNAVIFDLHHLDATQKDYEPAYMFRKRWDSIEKEVNKCVLLCANCHRLEHQEESW